MVMVMVLPLNSYDYQFINYSYQLLVGNQKLLVTIKVTRYDYGPWPLAGKSPHGKERTEAEHAVE